MFGMKGQRHKLSKKVVAQCKAGDSKFPVGARSLWSVGQEAYQI